MGGRGGRGLLLLFKKIAVAPPGAANSSPPSLRIGDARQNLENVETRTTREIAGECRPKRNGGNFGRCGTLREGNCITDHDGMTAGETATPVFGDMSAGTDDGRERPAQL